MSKKPTESRRLLNKPTDWAVAAIVFPIAVVLLPFIAVFYGAYLAWGIVHYTVMRWR